MPSRAYSDSSLEWISVYCCSNAYDTIKINKQCLQLAGRLVPAECTACDGTVRAAQSSGSPSPPSSPQSRPSRASSCTHAEHYTYPQSSEPVQAPHTTTAAIARLTAYRCRALRAISARLSCSAISRTSSRWRASSCAMLCSIYTPSYQHHFESYSNQQQSLINIIQSKANKGTHNAPRPVRSGCPSCS